MKKMIHIHAKSCEKLHVIAGKLVTLSFIQTLSEHVIDISAHS